MSLKMCVLFIVVYDRQDEGDEVDCLRVAILQL